MIQKLATRLTKRSITHDLHGDLRGRNDGVVRVGHEARVHAIGESLAGGVEGRLGYSVVLGEELEDDGVADGDIVELVRLEDETSGATDGDGVAGTSAGDGCSLVLLDSGSHAIVHGHLCRVVTSNNGLGDSDLLVDRRRLGLLATRVRPDHVGRHLNGLVLGGHLDLRGRNVLGGRSRGRGVLHGRRSMLHDRRLSRVFHHGRSNRSRVLLDDGFHSLVTVTSDATSHSQRRKRQNSRGRELHFELLFVLLEKKEVERVLSKAVRKIMTACFVYCRERNVWSGCRGPARVESKRRK